MDVDHNPENSLLINIDERKLSHFSVSTISSFKSIEKKHDVYRVKRLYEKLLW